MNIERQDCCDEFYSGSLYKQFKNSLPENKKNCFLTTTFNSDGSPVFESSAFSIWPIQMIINELPYRVRTSKPIICGLWFGKQKPDMDIFFEHFVTNMNRLSNEGLLCNLTNGIQRLFVYCICCCVDSQARAPMQGIKQFNGYYGCNWCLHPGYYVGQGRRGCVKYVLLDEVIEPRTNINILENAVQTMESGQSVFGVTHLSALSTLESFGMKSGFVPDSMHCIDLGVAGQFLKYWLESSNMPYSLTKENISKIDAVLKKVKVPKKVSRFSRSITDRSYWKAKEWQNWILYYSMPVLLLFPHLQPYAKHWNLLVQSYFILMQQNIPRQDLLRCDRMLKKFVLYTEYYYGRSAMTYNVHQLLHLTQSVADWGPLWTHFGYFFENGKGKIVKMVHAAKGVLSQICRRIGIMKSEIVILNHVEENRDSPVLPFIHYLEQKISKSYFQQNHCSYCGPDYPISLNWIRQLQLSDASRIYHKMLKDNCMYTSSKQIAYRSNNYFAVTKQGLFIQIKYFIVDPDQRKEFTICNPINTVNISFDNEDFSSIKKFSTISSDLIAIKTNSIDKICVQISTDSSNKYISPVPNLYSY